MPRVTKAQTLAELRTILLYTADHIAIGASWEAAEAFIGFEIERHVETYTDADPARVDLSRFHATELFECCYDYAFTPSYLTEHDGSLIQDIQVFMDGTPRCGGGGEVHDFMSENGACRIVADAALARSNLDEGEPELTTRELALLADMTEGAVRNALADKGENGLRAIPGRKNPVVVERAEALRWLEGRRGFVPSPRGFASDRVIPERIRAAQTPQELGRIIDRLAYYRFTHERPAAVELGWTPERFEAWCAGAQAFDEAEALQLAAAFSFDAPLFVGKAREVTLRRDLAARDGVSA